ncbi:MAG: type I-C CRISPR-associated protein Cas5c, partial [Clostridia bacterium]
VERVSYDVPTPSALVGLISNVYWHRGIKYVIDKIHVINDIDFVNIRRNEVTDKLSLSAVKEQIRDVSKDICIYTKDCITQRASLLLKNVCYGVEAHFTLTDKVDKDMTEEKCFAILSRRLRRGQCYVQPCLGCREFPAKVEMVDVFPKSHLSGAVDLGYMLYDLQYKVDKDGKDLDSADPRFYRPKMIDGVIDVAEYAKEILC